MDCCFHTACWQNVNPLCCCTFIDNGFALTVSHACLFGFINKDAKGIITVSMNSKVTQMDSQPLETVNRKNYLQKLSSSRVKVGVRLSRMCNTIGLRHL